MHRMSLALASTCLALGCTPVQPLVAPVPRYPAMLRGVAAVGDVPVRVKIDRNGKVQSIRVDTQFTIQPAGRELVAVSVQRAVRAAQFAPARRFGVAVSGQTDFVYRFALTRPSAPMRSDERPGITDSLPMNCPSASAIRIVVVCVPAYPTRARVVY
jgi:TonB family protein